VGAFLNLVRNVGSVIGQAMATAVIAGIMLSRGAEVQLSELASTTDAVVTNAFLSGWKLTFLMLAVITSLALVAAIRTKTDAVQPGD